MKFATFSTNVCRVEALKSRTVLNGPRLKHGLMAIQHPRFTASKQSKPDDCILLMPAKEHDPYHGPEGENRGDEVTILSCASPLATEVDGHRVYMTCPAAVFCLQLRLGQAKASSAA